METRVDGCKLVVALVGLPNGGRDTCADGLAATAFWHTGTGNGDVHTAAHATAYRHADSAGPDRHSAAARYAPRPDRHAPARYSSGYKPGYK